MDSVKAYLQITMKIDEDNRAEAADVYAKYRDPFLETIEGALTKNLLVRDEDVQVLHGFDSKEHAEAYLESDLFQDDVFAGLQPLWSEDPDVRIYSL
jgi:quinol monooxygenase YgiN